MEEKLSENFLMNEATQIIREMKGEGQLRITTCVLQADGDRYITVSDIASLNESPITYIYSMIPYEDDPDVQDFFIRHKKLIEAGIYDN
ncbi:hypothetical protein [Salimicrobium halophilum]|uniref:Uncharacterized protein n=1 Tax=Salimicrobium halophilum TaxID=86666 RepID=A0A1G8W7P1_9BACI|nr:hypothetical protein [Salimicrobium halophilum]SDJ73755.1 hypothetical protein SAMN04490247_3046 [Salimicrobium halophilum]